MKKFVAIVLLSIALSGCIEIVDVNSYKTEAYCEKGFVPYLTGVKGSTAFIECRREPQK
jgi:hypothetical protein